MTIKELVLRAYQTAPNNTIDNSVKVLSAQLKVPEKEIKKAIKDLCLEGKIKPCAYSNTIIPN